MRDRAIGDLSACTTSREQLVDLLTATAREDHAAFAALYQATKAKLFGVALALLRRRETAEDVLQEAYVRIWRHAARFDPARASPITWMATIVRNLAIDVLRSPSAQPTEDESELLTLPAPIASALQTLERSEEQRRVLALLDALDPVKRRLVVAAYLHGESRQQLARRFGVPVNTVKTWLRRAILDMQAKRDEIGEEGLVRERVA
jgi:RNA polymerase sigma-70 factor, ECF subfamily